MGALRSDASIRSVEDSSSLEIFNASMTDVQAITRICHAQYCFKGTLMQIRKSPQTLVFILK